MAENNDNAPPVEKFGDTVRSGVDHPGNFAYATDNISIPPYYISLVNGGTLFHGREDEEPISHLNAFYKLTMNHRPANVPHDNIKRALFPFSLRDKTREWYDSLSGYNVATFEDPKSKFLLEYNSPMKIERLRDAITSFQQQDDESFAETWKRFTEMLRKCPSHGLAPGRDLVKFYQGLNNESMGLINASTGGDLDNKTHEEVRTLFQKLAGNQRNWYNPRRVVEKKGNTFGASVESERMTAVEAQLANISTQMASVVKAVSSIQLNPQPQIVAMVKCGLCQGGHHTDQCQMIQSQETVEDVNYIGNNRQGFSQGCQFNNNPQNWKPQQ
ncbi:uncharacterized protein LOC121787200 [Salvia splendens]|uniref:uncharacterized protein LOC121787200 n=1 Tax=Salvia splendens TaxID=180675 RepID=UPI001C267E3A|nr:uncharacterized protein LOC121787200 [Salvia splendens]